MSNPYRSIIVLCFGIISTTSSQTCIIAILDTNQIVIGADAKSSPKTFAPFAPDESKCKIRQANGFVYVTAGFSHDPLHPNLVPDSIIMAIRAESGQAIISEIQETIQAPLETYFEGLRKDNPNAYLAWFNKPKPAFEVAIFGFTKNGKRFVFARGFMPPLNLTDPMKMRVKKIDDWRELDVLRMGTFNVADEVIFSLGEQFCRRKPSEAIYMAIEGQIKSDSTTVGYPISVLRITQTEKEWIKKGLCR